MELESLEFKVVMDDGPNTQVLARAASLDIASAAYMAAVALYHVRLRHGARIVRRHEGEPTPEPPPDPNLRRWSAHLIGGKKMQLLGFVKAVSEAAATETAVTLSGLTYERRKRLAINPRR